MNVHEAKTHLSRLLQDVEAGEEILICRAGKPVARLSSSIALPGPRTFGHDEGVFVVPDDFDDPLPEFALLADQGPVD